VRDHPGELFAGLLVVAWPVIVFGLADYMWFFRDDWNFIAERELSLEDLFEPHNAHWTTVPVVAFRVLYAIFGLHTYVPYLAVVVAAHLAVVALIRTIMVRAGVGPWVANAFAAALVFFGPGREDIVWAFQIGFTGAIALVLGQLVLADHDGPVGRRDAAGLALGLLGLMSAGVAVVLVGVVGLALLVRHGWRRAALHTAPLAAIYLVYDLLADPVNDSVPAFGLSSALDWIRHGLEAGFRGIGHYRPVVVGLLALLVAGLVVHLFAPGGEAGDEGGTGRTAGVWSRVREVAVPLALFAGVFAFIVVVARSRAFQGPQGAEARRYVYFYGVGLLPVLAVAAQALVRRWRLAAPVVLLVLLAVPANVASFDDPPFAAAYFESRRVVLLAVLGLSESGQVDGSLRPIPDPFMGNGVTLDFLRNALATGALPDPPDEIPQVLRNELLVRLAIHQQAGEPLYFCTPVGGQELRRDFDEGDALGISGPVVVQLVVDGQPVAPAVGFAPVDGSHLVGTMDGTELLFRPAGQGGELPLCTLP
jgi:hypothetical protein